MAVPDFQSVMLPFLETLRDGKERTMREVTESLAVRFKLTDRDREEHLASGPQPLFYNRVAWAKTHLKNAGLIVNLTRGKVSISEAGKLVLDQKPPTVNCSYLKFIGQAPGPDGNETEETILESTKTPLELMDTSFNTLRKATAEDLLGRPNAASPAFFEQVVFGRQAGHPKIRRGNGLHSCEKGRNPHNFAVHQRRSRIRGSNRRKKSCANRRSETGRPDD